MANMFRVIFVKMGGLPVFSTYSVLGLYMFQLDF